MKHLTIILTLLSFSLITSAQTKVDAKCKLWTPTSFCDSSETLNTPTQIYGKNCTMDVQTCQQIENKKNLHGVHIKFSSTTDSTFNLTSKFKNISLKRKADGKIIHPYAIKWYGWDYDSKTGKEFSFLGYMINRFKTSKYTVTYNLNKTYDLILLFDSAEKGDVIEIDNFIKTTIE